MILGYPEMEKLAPQAFYYPRLRGKIIKKETGCIEAAKLALTCVG